MDKVKDAIKWLGIDQSALLPLRERTYNELVRIAKASKRPVSSREIAASVDLAGRTVRQHLDELRKEGRADWITAKGWIPLR